MGRDIPEPVERGQPDRSLQCKDPELSFESHKVPGVWDRSRGRLKNRDGSKEEGLWAHGKAGDGAKQVDDKGYILKTELSHL